MTAQHDAAPDPDDTSDLGFAELDSSRDLGFAELDLPDELLAQLDELGYEEPTSIQREAVPPLVSGRDVLGQAATGTGKTAAFALPLLTRLHREGRAGRGPFGLVVVPTRELAMQVSRAIHTYGTGIGARVLPVYGGQPISRQIKRLSSGVDVVVATPGRAVDHLGRGTLDLSGVAVVVLDEADEMLDMGFAEDLESILDAVPPHQTALFSATMPRRLQALAGEHLVDPVRVSIDRHAAAGSGDVPRIREQVVVTDRHHKEAALARVLDVEDPTATLVFCRTRTDVEEVARSLAGTGRDVRFLHGGLDQGVRSRVLADLRDGTIEVVVATDVAARGLDVDVLSHVVNHSLPTQPEQYVHRIGRVGRAGREGVAITLVEPRQTKALRALERHLGRSLEVAPVPTVEQLRVRRTDQLVARVRDRMQRDELPDGLRAFDALGDVEDAPAIAVAALALLHEDAAGVHDTTEVPQLELRGRGGDGGRGGRDRGQRRGGRDQRPSSGAGRAGAGETARVWLSVGRNVGTRPKDVLGAVCGETGLAGSDVGEITIMGRFSLVEVPAEAQQDVVEAMRGATVRGKRVHAKPDRAG